MLDIKPSVEALAVLPEPWLSDYKAGCEGIVVAVAAVARELARESGMSHQDRQESCDELLAAATRICEGWCARLQQNGTLQPETPLQRGAHAYAIAVAAMQEVLDSYAWALDGGLTGETLQ
jgi:hypothetical protein